MTEASMLQQILKTAFKSCNLDPIPTPLTKQYLDVLVPVITKIINASLTTGIVPDCFKSATVKPLLKKPGHDVNDLKNKNKQTTTTTTLRLSLIFHFSLKFLKMLFWHSLNPICLETTSVKFASSHIGKNHNTETLLLSVTDSLLCKADNRFVLLLTLLDQSAAFDTIDHTILFNRLSYFFGINGIEFKWFISYLSNRTQSVSVGDLTSSSLPLKYGVPQVSVLGPIFFFFFFLPCALNLFLTKLESTTSVTRNLQMIRNFTRHPNPRNFHV